MPTPPIPQPLRAAAGLAAVAIDSARKLPQQVVGLPVLAVSAALQASLKAQQRYAELVTRGDQLLGQLRGQEEGTPAWARFDDDVPGPARSRSAFDLAEDDPEVADLLAAGEDEVAAMADAHPVADLLAAGQEDAEELAAAEAAADALGTTEPAGVPAAEPLDPEEEAIGLAEAAELEEAAAELEEAAADMESIRITEMVTTVGAAFDEMETAQLLDAGEPTDGAVADGTVADDGADAVAVADALAADGYLAADAPLPGYDAFTLPQLRGRLRSLSADQLEALAAYERATRQRAPFLTMLDNRLATVRDR